VARFPTSLLDVVGTVIRLGLAAVWLISGGLKVANADQTAVAVQAYRVLPTNLVGLVAAVLPFLELAFGLLVLVGIGQRLMGVLAALLLLVYIAAIAQSWARGLHIDCGCFTRGGEVGANQTQYPQDILRDVGFLVLAAWLIVRPRSLFSVDGWLGGSREEQDEQDETGGADSASSVVGSA
jgi:uncharacterized membrane protein YphA (DoxX/SURF4 family)